MTRGFRRTEAEFRPSASAPFSEPIARCRTNWQHGLACDSLHMRVEYRAIAFCFAFTYESNTCRHVASQRRDRPKQQLWDRRTWSTLQRCESISLPCLLSHTRDKNRERISLVAPCSKGQRREKIRLPNNHRAVPSTNHIHNSTT